MGKKVGKKEERGKKKEGRRQKRTLFEGQGRPIARP